MCACTLTSIAEFALDINFTSCSRGFSWLDEWAQATIMDKYWFACTRYAFFVTVITVKYMKYYYTALSSKLWQCVIGISYIRYSISFDFVFIFLITACKTIWSPFHVIISGGGLKMRTWKFTFEYGHRNWI